MNQNLLNTIRNITTTQKARFASLVYTNKHEETSRYTVLLGASHEVAYKKDLAKLLILQPRLTGIPALACGELIASLKASLSQGIGKNPAYTKQGVYEETDIKGLKIHKETGNLHLVGYVIKKEVIQPGFYPVVKSAQKTIEKNKLKKLGRLGKIREFVLSPKHAISITTNRKTLVFSV